MADIRDSLFGTLATRGHFILDEQVQEALAIQRQFEASGDRIPHLGEILVSKGYMTPEQVQAVLQGQGTPTGTRFGEIAKQWRLCKPEDVDAAVAHQADLRAQGQRPMRLGEILVTRGALKPHQVKAVLNAQGKTIVVCVSCSARYNAKNVHQGTKVTCPRCHTEFVPIPSAASQRLRPVKPEPQARRAEDVRADITVAVPAVRAPGSQNLTQQQIGSYQLLQRLGVDHSGELYKAFHPQTGNTVALRVLLPHIMQSPEEFEMWSDASDAAADLNHPNLQRILRLGSETGRAFVVSEFIEGHSLRQRLERGRIPYVEAVDVMIQCAEALAYGHSHELIHGDLRPSHVLIGMDGRVRVAGLGTPKQVYQDLKLMASQSGKVPVYAPPEVLIEEEASDARSDIYSLCGIGYHMLTGRPPQEGSDMMQVGFRIASQDISAPRTVDSHIPPYLNRLLLKGLSPEPDERYETIEELLTDLRKCRAALLIQAPDVAEVAGEIKPGVERLRKVRRRARTLKRMRTYKTRAGHGHRPPSRSRVPAVRRAPSGGYSGVHAGVGPAASSAATVAVSVAPPPQLPPPAPLPGGGNALEDLVRRGEVQVEEVALTPPAPVSGVRAAVPRRRGRRASDEPLNTSEDVQVSPATTIAMIVGLLVFVMGGLWLIRKDRGGSAHMDPGETTAHVEEIPREDPAKTTKTGDRPQDREARGDWGTMVGAFLAEHPEDHEGILKRADLFIRKYKDLTPPVKEFEEATRLRREHAESGAAKTLPELQTKVQELSRAYRFREADAEILRWENLWGAAVGARGAEERKLLKDREKALAEELLAKAAERRDQEDWDGSRELCQRVLEQFDPRFAEPARAERRKTDDAESAAKAKASLDAERERRKQEAAAREGAAPARLDKLLEALQRPLPRLDLEAALKLFEEAEKDLGGTSVGPHAQLLKADVARLDALRQRVVRAAQEKKLVEVRVKYQDGIYRVIGASPAGPVLDIQGGQAPVKWDALEPAEVGAMAAQATDATKGDLLLDLALLHIYSDRAYDAEKALKSAAGRGAATKLLEEKLAQRQQWLAAQKAKKEAPPPEQPPEEKPPEGPVQDQVQQLALKALGWEITRGVWTITPEKSLLARAEPGKDLMLLRRALGGFNTLSMELRGNGDAAGYSFTRSARFLVKPTDQWQKVSVEVHGGDKLRLLVDGEPRSSLEDVGDFTTEQMPDVVYIRAQGSHIEIRNFSVDGKHIGEPAQAPAVEAPPKEKAPLQDPAHAQALRVLGWELVDGVWAIRDEIVAGESTPAGPDARLKRPFKGAGQLSVEVRGTAESAGFSFGKGRRYLVKPSTTWKKLELRVKADGSPGLYVDGVLTPSLEDTSTVTGAQLGDTLYLGGSSGKVEFRNFRLE
ncbi:MAG: protein kinase [Planctomycetota bacterium]|nr:protein kinase [Planctomycetota bacterium]